MALTSVSDNLIGATLNPLWRSMNFPFPEKWKVHCEHPVSKSALKLSSSQADQYCGYLLVPSFRQNRHQQSLFRLGHVLTKLSTWVARIQSRCMVLNQIAWFDWLNTQGFIWLVYYIIITISGLPAQGPHQGTLGPPKVNKEITSSLHILLEDWFHSHHK